jgi:2-polyprenyl-3-methyl-5-hydroxy-6-metoxy-1,4-benzoquinol methylase
MLHQVPKAAVVDRAQFILAKCRGKRVLNVGSASGGLHEAIREVATDTIGLDRERSDNARDICFDLDSIVWGEHEPRYPSELIDIVVMGEILEHLAMPGATLQWLKENRSKETDVLISVPNALGASRAWANDGIECVNRDHVAWYSYRTLKTLVERYGFEIQEFCWYNGRPMFAEGIIFVVR